MGTLYDMNKAAIINMPSLTNSELKKNLKKIKQFFLDKTDKYFMLLNRETYNFTLFNLGNKNEIAMKQTMDDFKDISEWLKDAFENHKEFKGYGLYHNLDGFILDAFKEQKVFVLRYEGKAIAFLTFTPPSEECIRMIFRAVCVKPDFLRMGLATYLHESAIEYYKKRGCLVAELYHVCNESYKLGKSMGFVKKKEEKETDEVSMVKTLVDTRRQNRNANVRFVVWGNN